MADPSLFAVIAETWNLIPEPLRLGGAALSSGALGWAGKALTDRRQVRRIRSRLYKEMAHDYSQIVTYYLMHFERDARSYGPASIWHGLASVLRTAYYEHASENRDVFESLNESYSIDDWYKELSRFQAGAPSTSDLASAASMMAGYMQELHYTAHHLDRRLFLSFIPSHDRPLIDLALGNVLVNPRTAAKWAEARRHGRIRPD